MRIEALAQRSGISTRNIRAYQSAGLLAPPTLRGRTGFYEPEHLERLLSIRRLQDRGFSLAAIRQLLDAQQSGLTLEDVLAARTPAEHRTRSELDPIDELVESLGHWRGGTTGLLPSTFSALYLTHRN